MTKTKYYDLQMDDPQDDYDVEVVNANLKKIDEQMKTRENATDALQEPEFTGYRMRVENSKYSTVKALQSIGFETIASGDSHNDLGMIKASKAGFLFKSTEQIKKDNPELPAYETYDELMEAIKKAL